MFGAIVGDAGDDAETRPAMGAIGEGIAEATLEGIGDLPGTGGADRRIGGDLRMRCARGTPDDAELVGKVAREVVHLDTIDAAERRRLPLHALDEGSDRHALATDADKHARRVVEHFARKAEVARQTPHGRAEADALDAPAHSDLQRAPVLRHDRPLQVHGAASQRRTRLLPELAMITVSPQAATP